MKLNFFLILKGMAMGIAEVIPGVSGGTIAFITGIYEELIDTIKGIRPQLISVWKNEGFSAFWSAINGWFIIQLMAGMVCGAIASIFIITHLIENYPEVLWAFFFGLILASALYIYQHIPNKNWLAWLLIIVGTIFAFWITSVTPAEGSTNYVFVFFSGLIAISALLLPGISGSFILLILGMYVIIYSQLKELLINFTMDGFLIIAVFASGCLVGLFSFARVLSYAFKNYKSETFALLCGFMLGSLNKIWPWREAKVWMDKAGNTFKDISLSGIDIEELKVLEEVKKWPWDYSTEPYLLISIIAFVAGISIVFILAKYGQE